MAGHDESLGPNMSVVVITGLLTFILGGMLGLASLISQPVTTLANVPKADTLKPGEVIFVRGSRLARSAWRDKEEALKQGQWDLLAVTESEINQWSEQHLKAEAPKEAEGEEPGWMDRLRLEVQPVNARLDGERLQLATELKLPGLLPNSSFLYQIFGRFESTPDGVRFVPEEGTLGRAPLGSLPLTREWLYGWVLNQYAEIEGAVWLASVMEGLDSIDMADGQLVLRPRAAD